MGQGGIDQDEAPIGELVGRLIDQGKDYARAELDLAKARAGAKGEAYKLPALMLASAFLFLQAAVIVLCMGIAAALAPLLGPFGGGLVATLVALGIASGLAFAAKQKLDAAK